MYSEPIIAVTRGTPKRWVNQSPGTVTGRYRVEHPVWTVAAQFCEILYMHNAYYLPGDCHSKDEELVALRQNNVEFYQMRSPESSSAFQSHCLLPVRTMINIEFDEELLVKYGTSYNFDSI